jgi:hypothetical protein
MLIQARYADPIATGAITLTFRHWRRPQVVAGNTYRTAAGRIVVDAVDLMDADRIADAEVFVRAFALTAAVLAEVSPKQMDNPTP